MACLFQEEEGQSKVRPEKLKMFPGFVRERHFQLETARLEIRWPRSYDAADFVQFAGDGEVAQMAVTIPHPLPEGSAAEFILVTQKGNENGHQLIMAISPKSQTHHLIGCIGLRQDSLEEAEFGYWLGKPYWRQGLMTEAALAMLELTFRLTHLQSLIASVRHNNDVSRHILEKLGFVLYQQAMEEVPELQGRYLIDRLRLQRETWLASSYAQTSHFHLHNQVALDQLRANTLVYRRPAPSLRAGRSKLPSDKV